MKKRIFRGGGIRLALSLSSEPTHGRSIGVKIGNFEMPHAVAHDRDTAVMLRLVSGILLRLFLPS